MSAESFGRDAKRVVCKASHDHVSVDYASGRNGQAVVAVCPYSGRRGATYQALLSETLSAMACPKYGQWESIFADPGALLSSFRSRSLPSSDLLCSESTG